MAKDKAHPFIVEIDKQKVEVLGTHFNISSYAALKEAEFDRLLNDAGNIAAGIIDDFKSLAVLANLPSFLLKK